MVLSWQGIAVTNIAAIKVAVKAQRVPARIFGLRLLIDATKLFIRFSFVSSVLFLIWKAASHSGARYASAIFGLVPLARFPGFGALLLELLHHLRVPCPLDAELFGRVVSVRRKVITALGQRLVLLDFEWVLAQRSVRANARYLP